MINYLVRLGWSHGDQEFFQRQDLIDKFDLEHLGRSASMFDPDKLLAVNAKHIQTKSPKELADPLLYHLENLSIHAQNDAFTQGVIETLQPRSKTLKEMAGAAAFYYWDTVEYEEKAVKKFLKPETLGLLNRCIGGIQNLESFTQDHLESLFKGIMEETGLGFGKIAQPLRVAITGTTVSPGIFEMLLALGSDTTVKRLKQAVAKIQG
jgi:glutamyl-tRNA synthetase